MIFPYPSFWIVRACVTCLSPGLGPVLVPIAHQKLRGERCIGLTVGLGIQPDTMDTEDEDILMADEGEVPTGASAAQTLSGHDRQPRPTERIDGVHKQGQALAITRNWSLKRSESRSAGQTPRSTSVLANDVAGNLNISTSYSDEDHDELADDDSDSESVVRSDPLPYSKLPSGLCYDVRMRYHCELEPLPDEEGYIPGADPDLHPEDPRRIWSIYRELCLAGLVDDRMSIYGLVKTPLTRIEARHASPAEICLVHTKSHYDFVVSLQSEQ